jgi:rare lipoprotein A
MAAKKISPVVPKYEKKSRYGNPKSYTVRGKTYHVLPTADHYVARGTASWYGKKFHGRLTSTREPYDMHALTAASPVLPIPCYVRVTNLNNQRSLIVRVNDRGPFAKGRIMDLSYAAAVQLGYADAGTAPVEVRSIDTQPPELNSPSGALAPSLLYLQVGAFHERLRAEQLKTKLQAAITQPILITPPQGPQTTYRVQIGPLKDIQASDNLFERLKTYDIHDAITLLKPAG